MTDQELFAFVKAAVEDGEFSTFAENGRIVIEFSVSIEHDGEHLGFVSAKTTLEALFVDDMERNEKRFTELEKRDRERSARIQHLIKFGVRPVSEVVGKDEED